MSKNRLRNKIEEIQNTSIGESQTNKILDLIEQEITEKINSPYLIMAEKVPIYLKELFDYCRTKGVEINDQEIITKLSSEKFKEST